MTNLDLGRAFGFMVVKSTTSNNLPMFCQTKISRIRYMFSLKLLESTVFYVMRFKHTSGFGFGLRVHNQADILALAWEQA